MKSNNNTNKLAMSNFTIGKEPVWLHEHALYHTTCQTDYPPKQCLSERVGLSKKPPVANIFHKDTRDRGSRGDQSCSVSHEQFIKKLVVKNEPCKSLNKTNFKMDKDKRIETFRTTQAASYSFQLASPRKKCTNPMESHIPDGTMRLNLSIFQRSCLRKDILFFVRGLYFRYNIILYYFYQKGVIHKKK